MKEDTQVLQEQLKEMELYIKDREVLRTNVSKAPVGWHLSHSLKVFNNILDALKASDPEEYKSSFNFLKILVLTTGHIPRGKAKSPKAVLPPQEISKEHLEMQLKEALGKIGYFTEVDENAHFEHPYFNKLNRKETKRFLAIHTRHHLKIIRDILDAEKK
ncbi:DUF1569 domain-containing protein [Salinimicrobium sp. GXAS 041]|uniref:DUF1569 domain-containing protein n=1 Tax=Salinimicrobium sp. GXAS 041 TaxID=3400806 RepID=UPI003C75F55E